MKTRLVKVEDLWPGDVVIARRPGAYTGMPSRLANIEAAGEEARCARLHFDRDEFEFNIVVRWDELAEVVG